MSVIQLSNREKEILEMAAEGMTAYDIAEKLFLSPVTVENHKRNITRKLNAKNTTEAVAKAITMKLILNGKK